MEKISAKKEHNHHSLVFKVLRQLSNNLNVTDILIIPLIFFFLSCREKACDNKEFSLKTQNLIMNHKSQPIKLNPELPDIMSRSITFENILSRRVLEWVVILLGSKMKGMSQRQENLKIHLSDYAHYYNSRD